MGSNGQKGRETGENASRSTGTPIRNTAAEDGFQEEGKQRSQELKCCFKKNQRETAAGGNKEAAPSLD